MLTESSPDKTLLLQIKEDNSLAFDLLFERYWEKLYQAANARLNDDAIAQDIVQEIFIKLWQRRKVLEVQLSLEYYLLSAVRLSVMGHFRSQKTNDIRMQDALRRVTYLEDSIESHTDYLELERTLEHAVNSMPEMLQKVYQLRSENLSVKAIAGQLGLAEQTVKNYISEVLRRLRQTIIEKHPEKHVTYIAVLAALLHK
ncbi:RNA polymerase sigma factor [Mucilaginibacter endophyticus]|uniref:RNA polymerase sigma factor n=1 Tax=Mucilaginibacter endophyticus TaxID=2675003 RepID=UPI000E0DE684|nr:sigma-70 family RNA polymerase sigma factor [Mucilaginibacter endophyticus]